MKVTSYAVRNFPFTIVVFICLAALGVNSFLSLPRSEDPELKIPFFNIVVIYPGANPIDMERLVARPLEDRMKELDDIDKITTSVQEGVVIIGVEFFYGTDPDKKYDDVLRQANVERANLPPEILSLEVLKFRTSDVALMQVALVSPDASYARLQDLAESLRKRFEHVPGIRRADKHAFPDKQVRVSIDVDKLARMKLPLGAVVNAIQGANASVPGGAVEVGSRRFNIKTSGSYSSLDEVRDTPVSGSGAAVVYLKDVASVEWAYEELEDFGRFNGQRAVFVTAKPHAGINIFAARDGLREQLAAFRSELPHDVRLETPFDQSANVQERLGRLETDFLIAFALVLLTVLPLGFRASLLVMISIPLSLAMGMTLLYFTGYGLNQLSIVGCVIALGLLVDDSIVVVENIARFRRMGVAPIQAAIEATDQIAVAVIGTTAALLFAFLPLMMMPGGSGQFVRSMPVAVVYTVLCSMIVALTIVPFLASRVLSGKATAEGNAFLRVLQQGIERSYRPLLHWCMGHRLITIAVAAVLFGGSLLLVGPIGFSLFPTAGTRQFLIKIEAEEGASVAATDDLARRCEAVLAQDPQIAWYFTSIGRGNPQVYYNETPLGQKANTAELFVSLKEYDPKTSPGHLENLRGKLSRIPGGRIMVKEFEQGPPIEAPIAVRVFDEDLDQLAKLSTEVEQLLSATTGVRDVTNPLRVQRTDLKVIINHRMAAVLGIPEVEIERAVRLAFAGLNVARFRETDGDEYNIQLALPRGQRATLDNWAKIQVATQSGGYVPISQVADLEYVSTPPIIKRYNRERSTTVAAWVNTGYNVDKLTTLIGEQMSKRSWPAGVRWEFGGEVASRKESFGGIGSAIIIAVFAILAILVLEFKSFRGTIIVASVVPLGFVGGLVGLLVAGYSLSFTASIGFVALIGIEIKNSILLVDFTNQLREKGVPLREAIEQAGEIRFLPVVLTTMTAVGALMPLALQGSGLYSPLAVVIVGGLISSLVLSRLVTPVMYSLIPPPMRES
ncbi:multidrug transporter AcrB [Opitutaceae bacterium EW11]|nr:multidrug transporter AcrB [Opitutaceae bacterium EW11]